ncbi:MAG: argininosuccinate synthase [Gammaproteobacteria bacterium]|nr:argininosuccinate synthase [Gammaproteobacteria bacterium]MDD9875419.1 argininosuccinate synthase [Gammaproteobacteria bacterium]
MPSPQINKAVLAYSGGLDTSIILKWLQEVYACEVVTFTADIGQGEELESARAKARDCGAAEIFVEDLQEEFARDFVFPMFRANATYEGEYLLGTSIARPLISKHLVRIAAQTGADAIAHGATGKGNDQVRFELSAYALNPEIAVIAPWREWDLRSRQDLMAYARARGIAVEKDPALEARGGASPYSMDANLLHISYEGGELEDPWRAPAEEMWRWTVSPRRAPDAPQEMVLTFQSGDIRAVDGEAMTPAQVMTALNSAGARHGIGRADIVENRYVGMKNRGCYETPAGTIVLKARRAMESLTLDREVAHLKDELMPRYAKLIYNGYWFSPERRMLQEMIDASQAPVNGEVKIRLYKGHVEVLGRRSTDSLFDEKIVTFEHDAGAYNQADAGGFIRLNALRLRLAARKSQP